MHLDSLFDIQLWKALILQLKERKKENFMQQKYFEGPFCSKSDVVKV